MPIPPPQRQDLRGLQQETPAVNPNPAPSPKASVTETEPNDSVSTANAMSIGDVMAASLSSSSDVDYYKFTASADQMVYIDIDAYENGSSLYYSSLDLYDSDGTTSLSSFSANDPLITYTLPHAGTYYIKVSSSSSSGPYSLAIYGTGTITGSIARNDGSFPWFCPQLYIYKTNGYFLNSQMICGSTSSYSALVPANIGLKLYAAEYGQSGVWYNQKGSFSTADQVSVPVGGTLPGVNFTYNREVTIGPYVNNYSYKTGDQLVVNLNITNGPTPRPIFTKISLLYPETGLHRTYPLAKEVIIFSGPYTVPANMNSTVPVFTYTFNGSEPSGEYRVMSEFFYTDAMPVVLTYYSTNSSSSLFHFTP